MRLCKCALILMLLGGLMIPLSAASTTETVTYSYDSLGRLIGATYGSGPSVTMQYDLAGNWETNSSVAKVGVKTPAGSVAAAGSQSTQSAAQNTARQTATQVSRTVVQEVTAPAMTDLPPLMQSVDYNRLLLSIVPLLNSENSGFKNTVAVSQSTRFR